MSLALINILFLIAILTILLSVLAWIFFPKGKWHKLFTLMSTLTLALGVFFVVAAVLPRGDFYGKVETQLPPVGEKVVALTYDDGPYPPYTEELLEVLAQEKVQATFFMVASNAENHPATVQKVVQNGHSIGLHTLDHIDLLKLNKEQKVKQIEKGKAVLENLTGMHISLFRPPHGFRDWQVFEVLQENDLQLVNWSVLSKDWLNPTPEVIAERTLKQVHPGAIILLHDGDSPYNKSSRANTVQATKIIIRELKAQGYIFVRLTEKSFLEDI